jgi:hypothetical protein
MIAPVKIERMAITSRDRFPIGIVVRVLRSVVRSNFRRPPRKWVYPDVISDTCFQGSFHRSPQIFDRRCPIEVSIKRSQF